MSEAALETFEGLVEVARLPGQGMVTLRADLASDAAGAALRAAGLTMPGRREAVFAGSRGALWMSPDELMILTPRAEADEVAQAMTQALGQAHALVADVSDARAQFRLQGAAVREVIAKLAPVDMDPAVFRPGMLRRTRLAQVAAAFWMPDETTVRLVCFRSVVDYVGELLRTAAAPGSAVRYF